MASLREGAKILVFIALAMPTQTRSFPIEYVPQITRSFLSGALGRVVWVWAWGVLLLKNLLIAAGDGFFGLVPFCKRSHNSQGRSGFADISEQSSAQAEMTSSCGGNAYRGSR
ncbi:hypothetical protein CFIMG_007615RA00001 [Ceratocystis fimbriata CBS 114723]|uniref:Uncharacterized protein n=1 Tax=Ceratocystis fimbriata CBS 114723 TaxID=1035309 RepID=A0A2C5WVP9_9PEZI|nr:hypothetical protein CFIMG_007615RA00001 [Ceratocystis fimbriata CBS 114723]